MPQVVILMQRITKRCNANFAFGSPFFGKGWVNPAHPNWLKEYKRMGGPKGKFCYCKIWV